MSMLSAVVLIALSTLATADEPSDLLVRLDETLNAKKVDDLKFVFFDDAVCNKENGNDYLGESQWLTNISAFFPKSIFFYVICRHELRKVL